MSSNDPVCPDLSETIVNASAAPVFLLDRRGCVTFWNQRMTTLTGISGPDMLNRSLSDLFSRAQDRDRWTRYLRNLSSSTPHFEVTSEWKSSSGKLVYRACTAVLTGGGTAPEVIVCVVNDSETLALTRLEARTLEMTELARYVHETLAQDLVQLSFVIEAAAAGTHQFGLEPKNGRPQNLLERCCSRVRVLSAMLAPAPFDVPIHEWLPDYAGFLKQECGLQFQLDIDPLPVGNAGSVSELMATTIQLWISKAVRARGPALVSVRIRERSGTCAVELQTAAESVHPLVLGWSEVEQAAYSLAGLFTVIEENGRALGDLALPLSSSNHESL